MELDFKLRPSDRKHHLARPPLPSANSISALPWPIELLSLRSRADHCTPVQESLWLSSVFRINSKVFSGNFKAGSNVAPLYFFASRPFPHRCLGRLTPLGPLCVITTWGSSIVPSACMSPPPSLLCQQNGLSLPPLLASWGHLRSPGTLRFPQFPKVFPLLPLIPRIELLSFQCVVNEEAWWWQCGAVESTRTLESERSSALSSPAYWPSVPGQVCASF